MECFESALSYFGDTSGCENLCCSEQPVPAPITSASSGSLSETETPGPPQPSCTVQVTRTFCVVLCSSPQWDSRVCSSSPGVVFRPARTSLSKTLTEATEFHRKAMWYNGNNTAQRDQKLNSCFMSSPWPWTRLFACKMNRSEQTLGGFATPKAMNMWRHIARTMKQLREMI